VVNNTSEGLGLTSELSPEQLQQIYRNALLTRAIDERAWILSRQGKTFFVITGRGHEVAQAASVAALRPGHDWAVPYYRDMGVAVSLGVPPESILAGILWRADDPFSGARQLPAHWSDVRLKIVTGSSSVGTHIPHAVGVAYAARMRNEDAVCITYFGEGATSKGDFHEGAEMAALWKLPVIFFCENNRFAISVRYEDEVPTRTVADRAAGYGMPGITVDGNDAQAVYAATLEAVERARRGEGPTLVEANVVRMTAHSSDDDGAYLTDDERAAALAHDPLPRLRDRLIELGVLTLEQDEAERARLQEEIADLAQKVESWAPPLPETFRRHLFAEE
jgi:2-oxoisovalerate dehydrogenase E1 component alpha subunit